MRRVFIEALAVAAVLTPAGNVAFSEIMPDHIDAQFFNCDAVLAALILSLSL
jgi:hypothetical protein